MFHVIRKSMKMLFIYKCASGITKMSLSLGNWKTREREMGWEQKRERETGRGISAKSCMQHGRNETIAHKRFCSQKISSGAHDDLAHEQRRTMMDFKFHLPFGHSSQHTLRLHIGTRIGYTCPLWLTMDTVIAHHSPALWIWVIKPYRY